MKLKIEKVNSSAEAATQAAKLLVEEFAKKSGQYLLLLSGGSATEICSKLACELSTEKDLSWLTLGQLDERWGEPFHKDSNQKAIQQTELPETVSKRHGSVNWILQQGLECDETARRYDHWITEQISTGKRIVAVVGIGADSHTAGILPFPDKVSFTNAFPANRNVVDYETTNSSFKKRITVAPQLLSSLLFITGIVCGESKTKALKNLVDGIEPVYLQPANLLREISGTILTDQNI